MISLTTVQYRGSLACFGRVTAMRMLLEKFSPPQGLECMTNDQGKEDTNMCFDPRDIEQNDQATEQNETNVPATTPVTTEEPVAA